MDRFIKTAAGGLLTANVAVFVVMTIVVAIFGNGAAAWFGLSLIPWPYVWTPLTYMFANTGLLDLVFNCLWLWLFSRMLLEVANDRQLLLSYAIGGLSGALFFIIGAAMGLCSGLLFGASGAVLAVVCFAAMRVPHMCLNLVFFGPVKFMWIAAVAAGLSLLPLAMGHIGSGLAHLGGIAGGTLYALALKRSRRKFKILRPSEKKTLDELLDKVRRSGYASLNASERKQLLDYSNNL